MPDHDVAAEIGGELRGLTRVALHAQVLRRRSVAEARQCGSDEPDRRVAQPRLGKQVVVEGRRGERPGKQQNRVIGDLGPGLMQYPTEMFSGRFDHALSSSRTIRSLAGGVVVSMRRPGRYTNPRNVGDRVRT